MLGNYHAIITTPSNHIYAGPAKGPNLTQNNDKSMLTNVATTLLTYNLPTCRTTTYTICLRNTTTSHTTTTLNRCKVLPRSVLSRLNQVFTRGREWGRGKYLSIYQESAPFGVTSRHRRFNPLFLNCQSTGLRILLTTTMLTRTKTTRLATQLYEFAKYRVNNGNVGSNVNRINKLRLYEVGNSRSLNRTRFVTGNTSHYRQIYTHRSDASRVRRSKGATTLPMTGKSRTTNLFGNDKINNRTTIYVMTTCRERLFTNRARHFRLTMTRLTRNAVRRSILPIQTQRNRGRQIITSIIILYTPYERIKTNIKPTSTSTTHIYNLPTMNTTTRPIIIITRHRRTGARLVYRLCNAIRNILNIRETGTTLTIPTLRNAGTNGTLNLDNKVGLTLTRMFRRTKRTIRPITRRTDRAILNGSLNHFVNAL